MIKKLINKYFSIPENLFTRNNRYLIVATFFGCGYFKKAPGTFASLIALVLGVLIAYISSSLLIIVTTLLILVGFFVCEKVTHGIENKDPSYIVIDEVVGMLLSILLVHDNAYMYVLAFLIFRLLDIKKPWVIGMAETHFKGGTAVMLDDIVSGFSTLLIVTAISLLF